MPGETVLLAASIAAARGYLNIFWVFLVSSLAAVFGNINGYLIGRYGGRPLLERFGRRLFHSDVRVKKAEEYFDSHGGKTVFWGRFAAGIRVFVAALAGASKMKISRFIFYTISSVIIWTGMITAIGYFFGKNWQLIVIILRRIGWLFLAIFIILVIICLFRARGRKIGSKSKNTRGDKKQ